MKGIDNSIAKWAFSIFGLILILINLMVTYQFGSQFLSGTFGIQNSEVANIFGGLYAVLFFDVAYMVWLGLYLRGNEPTTNQRAIAGIGALVGFIGSLVATLFMLIQGTAGSLSVYATAIETIAQVAMILVVAVNIVLGIAYIINSQSEQIRKTSVNATTSATDKALSLAKNNIKQLVPELADQISATIEDSIITGLNFVRDGNGKLRYIPKKASEPKHSPGMGFNNTKQSTDDFLARLSSKQKKTLRDELNKD